MGSPETILEKHGYKVPGGIGVQNYEKEGGKLILPAAAQHHDAPQAPQGANWAAKGFTEAQKKFWAFQPVKRPACARCHEP